MNIPFTDLKAQYQECKQDIDTAVQDIFDRTSFITGPDVDCFERLLTEYTGADDCSSTGSCTTALAIALKACGIGLGDEVITVSHTFVSTVESIVNVGAIPVLADINKYYTIDTNQVKQSISDRTRAIIYVDLYGQSGDVEQLIDIAKQAGVYLICDAAQSFGARWKEHRVGGIPGVDLTCVSFNPVKNLGAHGDAGCILGRKDLIEKCRMYRDHGRNTKFVYETVGYNARIDNVQAAVVAAKLPYLDAWLDKRRSICERYNRELEGVVQTPATAEYNQHSWHVYCIQTDNRDDLREYLKSKGVGTNLHYPIPCHQQPAFKNLYWSVAPLTNTENSTPRILSLPCYHNLTNEQQTYIIDCIKQWKE